LKSPARNRIAIAVVDVQRDPVAHQRAEQLQGEREQQELGELVVALAAGLAGEGRPGRHQHDRDQEHRHHHAGHLRPEQQQQAQGGEGGAQQPAADAEGDPGLQRGQLAGWRGLLWRGAVGLKALAPHEGLGGVHLEHLEVPK
jgi:hypothetical protein